MKVSKTQTAFKKQANKEIDKQTGHDALITLPFGSRTAKNMMTNRG